METVRGRRACEFRDFCMIVIIYVTTRTNMLFTVSRGPTMCWNPTTGDSVANFQTQIQSLLEFGRIVDEETNEWIDKTEYAAMNVYTNARKRKVVEWPKVHADFNDWVAPIKKNRKKKGTK